MKKKILVVFIIIFSLACLFCEINLGELSSWEEGFSSLSIGHTFFKHNNRILLEKQRGIELYEIDNENNLDLILDFSLSNYIFAEFRNDYLVVSSYDESTEYLFAITLYDISDLDNIIVAGRLFSNIRTFTIQDDYLAISQVNMQDEAANIDIYNINTLELLHTVSYCAIGQSIYDTDKFIVYDLHNNVAKVVFINAESTLVTVGELNSSGKVILNHNNLLVLGDSVVDFYEIGESLEYLSSYSFAEAEELINQGVFYNGEVLGFLTLTEETPYRSYITLYNILDLDNIYKIEDVQLTDFDNYSWMFSTDTITFGNSFLHCYIGYGLVQYDYINNSLNHEVLKSSFERTYYERGFFKDNIYYDNYFRVSCYNNQLYLGDLGSIQSIVSPDTLGNIFFFGDDYQHKIVRNYETKSFDIYLENSEHNFDFIDSYQLIESTDSFRFIDILDWNGEDLFFSYGGKLSYVRYQNSSFSVVSVTNNVTDQVKWAKYNDYIYKISSSFIDVYQLFDNHLQLINTIMYSSENNSLYNCEVSDDILTIQCIGNGSRAYDLLLDPIDLSNELDLNLLFANSKVRRYNDYLIYSGSNNNIDSSGSLINCKYLNFFKKINDDYVYLGEYFCNAYVNDIEIMHGNIDNFTLIARTSLGIKIFSCEITSNNTLNVTPLDINCYNYPNPFNPETTISYDISQQGNVSVDIYNLKGQKVKSLLNETQGAGQHKVIWQGDNEDGKKVSSGTYFYKVKSGGEEIVKKMLLMK